MVSYKKLNPEDVQFSSTVLSEESRPAQEEVAVSSYQVSFFSAALSEGMSSTTQILLVYMREFV